MDKLDEPVDVSDPRVIRDLELCLEHPPPFTRDELHDLSLVVVSNAADLSWLSHCCSTRQIVLMGCAVWELFASELPAGGFVQLRRLELGFSSATSIRAFTGHPGLQDISLMDSLVSDASPLLTMPRRRYITLIGCPLNEESYFEVIPRLQREVPQRYAEDYTADELISYSPEPEWRLTRLIQSRGIRAVYSQGKALAPGLAYSDVPDLHSYRVTHDEVKHALDQVDDGDLHGFMDRCKQLAFSK